MRLYIVEYATKNSVYLRRMHVEAENKQDAWNVAIHSHFDGMAPLWAIVRGVFMKNGDVKYFKTDIRHPY